MDTSAFYKGYLYFQWQKFLKNEGYQKAPSLNPYLQDIKSKGYAVIADFISAEDCEKLRDEVDELIIKHDQTGYLWKDPYDSDNRVFGAESESDSINDFHKNPFLLSAAENYFKGKIINSNTLAARIDSSTNSIGSGQGWHRDGNFFQFKAIVYLSDVTEENGPFQIIEGSNNLFQAYKDNRLMGGDALDTRFTEEQIEKVIQQAPEKLASLTAKAGTLVLADVSSIHRGCPIRSGSRYTLFNYYYPAYNNIEERRAAMNCIPKVTTKL